MLTLLFDYQGLLFIDFKCPGVSIIGEWYCETPEGLQYEIKAKRSGQLRNGFILFRDNTNSKCRNTEVTFTKVGDTRAPTLQS